MTKKQYIYCFTVLSRLIFTFLTAEGVFLLGAVYELQKGLIPAVPLWYWIPEMAEILCASVLLYTVMAAAAALALREYGT